MRPEKQNPLIFKNCFFNNKLHINNCLEAVLYEAHESQKILMNNRSELGEK